MNKQCEQAVFPQKTVQTFSFHLMLNTCSSRYESSYFTFDALNLNLIMSLYLTPFFTSIIFLQSRATQLVRGTYLSTRYMYVIYMTNSPFKGWQYGRNSCMMEQESWFLPKLYNENFRSDDHCVTHKSWVQDASRRVCPYANKGSTYNLRTGSIHYVNMGRFSIWSQKGLISA